MTSEETVKALDGLLEKLQRNEITDKELKVIEELVSWYDGYKTGFAVGYEHAIRETDQ